MIGFRGKAWQRIGTALTGLVLGLQLMLSSLSLVIAAASTEPTEALNAHALCLAGGTPAPAGTPAAPHRHLAFCCLFHQLPAIEPAAASAPLPIAFAYVLSNRPPLVAFNSGPRRSPVNARAPPSLA